MLFLKALIYLALWGIANFVVGLMLPRSWFSYDVFPYRPWKFEKNGKFYEKLKIKKWKDKIPDMSRLFKFMAPKRAAAALDSGSMLRLIQETCVAEIVHIAGCIEAIPVLFICPNAAGIVLFILDIILGNLVFIIVQRYNRPRLVSAYKRIKTHEEREAAK